MPKTLTWEQRHDEWEKQQERLWNEQKAKCQGKQFRLDTPQFRMIDRNGPPEGMECPFFLCAACGEPVYSVEYKGMIIKPYVLWWDEIPPRDSRNGHRHQYGPFILHRPYCDRVFEAMMEKHLAEDGREWIGLSSDFEATFQHLVNNTTRPLGTNRKFDPEFPDECEYVAPYPSTFRAGHYERE